MLLGILVQSRLFCFLLIYVLLLFCVSRLVGLYISSHLGLSVILNTRGSDYACIFSRPGLCEDSGGCPSHHHSFSFGQPYGEYYVACGFYWYS